MVRRQSMSRWRGRLVRRDLSSAPRIASAVLRSSRSHQLGDDVGDDAARHVLGLRRHHVAQRDQVGDEVHVGLDRLQEFRLHQHLLQVEPLEGVLLDDLHDLLPGRRSGCRPSIAPRVAPSGRARRAACADRRPPCPRRRRRGRPARPKAAVVLGRAAWSPVSSSAPIASRQRRSRSPSGGVHQARSISAVVIHWPAPP